MEKKVKTQQQQNKKSNIKFMLCIRYTLKVFYYSR